MFFKLAKNMDSEFVKDQTTMPTTQLHLLDRNPIVMYDWKHVDKIHAQHQISNTMFRRIGGYDGFIEERIPEILTKGIAEEIMKVHKDEIKKTCLASMDGLLYSLDVYVCKPTKKEAI